MSHQVKMSAVCAALTLGVLIAITSSGSAARAPMPLASAGSSQDPLAQQRLMPSRGDEAGPDTAVAAETSGYLRLPEFESMVQYAVARAALPPTAPLAAPTGAPPLFRPVAVTTGRAAKQVIEPPKVSARNAVVLDEQSLTVLYDKDAHERRAPASLTKIVTAALAVQLGDLDDVVENTVDAYKMPGSSLMIIRPGEEYTLRDLLYGMMLRSGNDASLAIARHLSMSDELFVFHMNALIERLGLQDTHFIDPHGLGGRDHYSSAYDLAILARYGMQFPDFGTVVAASSWTARGTRTIPMSNLNPFINQYPGADGLKTGYTEAAGPTFIGSAVRDGRRLYVVLLNSGARWSEAAALLDWAFENYTWPEYSVSAVPEAEAEVDTVMLSGTMAVEAGR